MIRLSPMIPALLIAALLAGCGGGDAGGGENQPPDTNPPAATKPSETVAYQWNELLLQAIRNDLARPPVHARNLFHVSAAMYDAWAALDSRAATYLLGQSRLGVDCPAVAIDAAGPLSVREAVSYAAYRLIIHRYAASPGAADTLARANTLMQRLGYDPALVSTDLSDYRGAALGNRIAQCYIAFGLVDGANESGNYGNQFYFPVNPPLEPALPGNPDIVDMDRWQSLSLPTSIDQSGNLIAGVPAFVGAGWGRVNPFALTPADKVSHSRDGGEFPVYLDPGPPPFIADGRFEEYRWHFSLVARWAAHLDPSDGVTIDISPASIGNIGGNYLSAPVDPMTFYPVDAGGDPGNGRAINPKTSKRYTPHIVPRGDYTRVLAEYWADGPDSETPPGHWFVILNEIADELAFAQPIAGEGPTPSPLEATVKTYFTLGGAMHDAAIAAWGLKSWYDFVRPISAIRAMADAGQSSDAGLPSYSTSGLPLVPGAIELVATGDPLAGTNDEHIGKIKLSTWRGPEAGVGWMLAENWWPYQRPTFVTPPFAGYVSGHSTYSSAAATVLEKLTGDAFFPGGLHEIPIQANEFLSFERGPSISFSLQWATYRDAADQCSLSRIWGGIHPPADDLPGRRIGLQIGERAYTAALELFAGNALE